MNTLKTALLLGLLSALLLFGGEAIAGRKGLYMGLGLAVVMNFASYFFSDKIALATVPRAAGDAKPRTRKSTAASRPSCSGLASAWALPMPKL